MAAPEVPISLASFLYSGKKRRWIIYLHTRSKVVTFLRRIKLRGQQINKGQFCSTSKPIDWKRVPFHNSKINTYFLCISTNWFLTILNKNILMWGHSHALIFFSLCCAGRDTWICAHTASHVIQYLLIAIGTGAAPTVTYLNVFLTDLKRPYHIISFQNAPCCIFIFCFKVVNWFSKLMMMILNILFTLMDRLDLWIFPAKHFVIAGFHFHSIARLSVSTHDGCYWFVQIVTSMAAVIS